MIQNFKKALTLLSILVAATITQAQVDQKYMVPPPEILELVDIKMNPALVLSSDAKYAILMERSTFKTLDEMSEVEIGLGGIRINPDNGGRSRQTRYSGMVLREFLTGKEIPIKGLPENLKAGNLSFSPDDKHIAFTNLKNNKFELWLLDINKGQAQQIFGNVNTMMAGPYVWHPSGESIFVQFGQAQKPSSVIKPLPMGPTVQETAGSKAVTRTYQDLLKNKHDEVIFDAYMKGEWIEFNLSKLSIAEYSTTSPLLKAGIYRSLSWSPDGQFLLTEELQKPYSYTVPWYLFPFDTKIYDRSGKLIMTFHQTPLLEELPKGFDAVYAGKREIDWRSDEPATLYWVQALDKGDPAIQVDFRDALFEAKFEKGNTLSPDRELMKTKYRFRGVMWGTNKVALVADNLWKTRIGATYLLDPSTGKSKLIQERSSQDLYNDPGSPMMAKSGTLGQRLLRLSPDGKKIYLIGEGYNPDGNKPFFDEMDLVAFKTKRRWQADGKTTYERIVRVLNPEKGEMITSIESPELYPNYHRRTIGGKTTQQITQFVNPYNKFQGVSKQTIHYKRKDGVDLSGVLYLPPGYKKEKDGALPVLMWAYPREYKDASQAGQVKESPHRFVFLNYGSPVYWAKRGYAVFDRADFPIIGEGKTEPNDSFIEQLVMNAEAAINKLTELGIGDPKRMAIGGHSYGAFMTANLMAHSDLFAAGIARSGAYNRTLTPFGFQSEERTFWDNPELYMGMSPFVHADKINEPLLIIHGAADDNPGTFTLQSERLYGAIKGLGGTARLVLLPFESHGYSARENILHMLWETDQWLEKYVKNRK